MLPTHIHLSETVYTKSKQQGPASRYLAVGVYAHQAMTKRNIAIAVQLPHCVSEPRLEWNAGRHQRHGILFSFESERIINWTTPSWTRLCESRFYLHRKWELQAEGTFSDRIQLLLRPILRTCIYMCNGQRTCSIRKRNGYASSLMLSETDGFSCNGNQKPYTVRLIYLLDAAIDTRWWCIFLFIFPLSILIHSFIVPLHRTMCLTMTIQIQFKRQTLHTRKQRLSIVKLWFGCTWTNIDINAKRHYTYTSYEY